MKGSTGIALASGLGGFAVKTHDVGESESDSVSVSVKRL